jgi:hypothetical protein
LIVSFSPVARDGSGEGFAEADAGAWVCVYDRIAVVCECLELVYGGV